MRDFKTLNFWKKSHLLTLEIYRVTSSYPDHETYGLASQTRRAAASIPANIAEGCGRDTDADFTRFLIIANGSANELEYHLLLARDLNYVALDAHNAAIETLSEIRKMLTAFVKRLG